MDRRKFLLVALVVAMVLGATETAFADGFGDSGEAGSETSGTNNGDSTDIIGTQPGDGSGTGGSSSDADGDFVIIGSGGAGGVQCVRVVADRCYISLTKPGDVEPAVPTISDIATFRPETGAALMQPDGWGVVGIHTNFYATGGQHVVTGTLLGQPAGVRFTPVAWHWDYGDGASATSASAGSTWAELGIREFDVTPGSHLYSTKGSYTITLTIEYTAEYQYAGQPWRAIAGTVSARANDLTTTTWRVKTVLVAEDCLANPKGAGCPG